MKKFTLDDEVIQSKATKASNKIGSAIWNLGQADGVIMKAVKEINKHDELVGVSYSSYYNKFCEVNDIIEKYNNIECLVGDYCEEVDDNFFKAQEKIIENLSQLKIEDFKIPNTIGVTQAKTIKYSGQDYTYDEKKTEIGFEDLLSYGTVSEVMQDQYEEIKRVCKENGEEYSGDIDDYIKELLESGKFTYEVGWKKNVSLVLDLIPIVGDAKGVIECLVGQDLITGRELSALERGLCILSIVPLIGDGGTLVKVGMKEGLSSTAKFLTKETAVNTVAYMGSATLQEAGVNPLWGLAFYQCGRIGWKNKDAIIDSLKNLNKKDGIKEASKTQFKVKDYSGEDWNSYFKETYGENNVSWDSGKYKARYISGEFNYNISQRYIDKNVDIYTKYFELKNKGLNIQ